MERGWVVFILLVCALPSQAAMQMYFIHNDHLGTPRVITDKDQHVVWKGHPKPFGETQVEIETITNHRRFPGQRVDIESRLNYNYFRDYDPTTGRYIQSDPIGLNGGSNLYVYSKDDPLAFADPLGLCPDCDKSRKVAWSYYSQLQSKFPNQYRKEPSAILFAPLPADHGGMVSPLLPNIMFLPESFCDLNDENIFNFDWAVAHEGIHINQNWIDLIRTRGDNPAHDQIDQQALENTRMVTGRRY